MALIQSTAIPSGATDYELEQSLKFDDGRNTNLERLPVSAGNRKTWTYSCWVKRGNQTGDSQQLLSATNDQIIFRGSSQVIRMMNNALSFNLISTPVYRDNSAWYHIVVAFDTTQSTASNRIKLYVNGEQVTSFSTATYPSQNDNTAINNATTHYIGRYAASGSEYLDGYLAEVNFIDGQALTPADFGETGDYGEWKPIRYSGTYGTNGFYLPFKQDYTVEGFSTVTWKGNGGTQYIGGTGFQPDLTWIKKRDGADNHALFNSLVSTSNYLRSDTTQDERTNGAFSFETDGFKLTTGDGSWNASNTYVAWNWDMGGSNATNTNGSITSTVRANPTYGQSIVSYSGATNATVDSSNNSGNYWTIGHGLSEAPELIIAKNRGSGGWYVGSDSLGSTPWTSGSHLVLNSTAATANNANLLWGNAAPNSSTFKVGGWDVVNRNGNDYIAYCFHSVTGYSKFGSYTGSGSTGNAITTGFAPAFVMFKRTDTANDWDIRDNVRSPSNPNDLRLFPSQSGAEGSGDNEVDFTSTGFTLKSGDGRTNASGGTYIYMAFADKREYAYWLDQSGNNNDWTSNNLTESDISVDSPTNNFCTWNPLQNNAGATLSEGNLKCSIPGNSRYLAGTFSVSSGKWYCEITMLAGGSTSFSFAVAPSTLAHNDTSDIFSGSSGDNLVGAYDTSVYTNGSASSNYFSSSIQQVGAVLGIALDLDSSTQTVKFALNNSWGSAITLPVQGEHWKLFAGIGSSSGPANSVLNAGQDSSFAGNKTAQGNQDSNSIGDFYYTPPTGFLALCTKNLPDVDVVPSEHFNTVLYTGNGSTQSITGVGFQPDWIWAKQRDSGGGNHVSFDAVRGTTKNLYPDATAAEDTQSGVTAFNSDGFSVGSWSGSNNNGANFVAWNWKANGSGSSNTNGSITSTVSANVDAGFSIVSWVGNEGSDESIGHGLSKAPEMILTWVRDEAWGNQVYHKDMGTNKKMMISETTAAETDTDVWADTAPTSSVFYVGTDLMTNWDDRNYIGYCFHSVDGYSKVGKLHGNSTDDGTFVYTGFKPKMVMWKNTEASANWFIMDSERNEGGNAGNPIRSYLHPNSSAAENWVGTSGILDFTSNGFKYRASNNSSYNFDYDYIFIAFASVPFKFGNAR